MSVGKNSINRVNNLSSPQNNINNITSEINNNSCILDVEKLKAVPENWFFYDNSYIELSDIKASIKKYGILEPVIVRRLEDSSFQLLSGYKRVKAASELGLALIKCEVLQNLSEEEAREIFTELHGDKPQLAELHKIKFTAISKIKHDLPEYLL